MNYRNEWINACFTRQTPRETVTAYFTDGRTATYSDGMVEALKSEKVVYMIVSNETGEILHEN